MKSDILEFLSCLSIVSLISMTSLESLAQIFLVLCLTAVILTKLLSIVATLFLCFVRKFFPQIHSRLRLVFLPDWPLLQYLLWIICGWTLFSSLFLIVLFGIIGKI